MKLRKLLIIVLSLTLVACATGIIACKPAIKDVDMSGISFNDKTELYDGTAKTLTVSGTLPEGVSVAYEYYKGDVKVTEAKEIGVYTVKAIFTVDTQKYNPVKDMTAKLTISYNMQGIVMQDKTVTYNGETQTLTVSGTLPDGVTVEYEYFQGGQKIGVAKNAGVYEVKAVFSGDVSIEPLTATLTINKAVPSVTFGSKQHIDLGNVEDLETPLVFDKDDGGFYYEYDGKTYILGVVDSDVEVTDENISYYFELNGDGTPKEDTVTLDNTLNSVGDSLYVVVDLEESANYEAAQIVAKVTLHSKTVAISTYEDLLKINSDTKELPREARLNFRYVLQNDIDCEGRVWKTVDTIFGSTGLPFCSEFDGNGHTISNFLLTNESVESDKLADQNGLHIGFFGYITDAYIHDVTFDNVTANITTDGYTRIDLGGNCVNPIVFGVVAARMESDGSNGGETDLKNIKVSNADIKIAGYKVYAGVIVGWDHAKSEGVLRENLSVENVKINAIATTNNKDRVSVGGIVGETQGSDIIKYTNCSVKNLVITSKDANGEATYSMGFNYFGAFIGRVVGTSITFENCSVVNYAGIANTNIYTGITDVDGRWTGIGSYGYFGYAAYVTDYGTLVNHPEIKDYRYFPTVLNLVNCTHSVEEGKENEYYLQILDKRIEWIDSDSLEAVGPNGELMFKDGRVD